MRMQYEGILVSGFKRGMAALQLPCTRDEMCKDRVVPPASPPLSYGGADYSGLLGSPLGLVSPNQQIINEAVPLNARKGKIGPMPCIKAH